MGRYDIIVKTEEVRRRVQAGEFVSALKVMDTILLKKVKNIADLSLFAEIYTQNERYDEAMELLNRVYKKSKTRRVLYQMVLVSIGRKDILEAERFLEEYEQAAPNDFSIYIFRYKIDKIKKEPYIVLIDSLMKLKNYTYIEKWAYELAKLYYKAGMEEECIQECSDLILWFGEGSYVEKAKILKAYYSGEVAKEEVINKLKKRVARDNGSTENEDIQYEDDNILSEVDQDNALSEIAQDSSEQSEELDSNMNELTEESDSNRIILTEQSEDSNWEELSENVGKEVELFLADEHSSFTDS